MTGGAVYVGVHLFNEAELLGVTSAAPQPLIERHPVRAARSSSSARLSRAPPAHATAQQVAHYARANV